MLNTADVQYMVVESIKLRNAILADPAAEYSWKESFRRAADGWHRGGVQIRCEQ
jgi:hypothetical protein